MLPDDAALGAAYAAGVPDDRPWLRAVLVASADGAAVADGGSAALSGPADKRVFAVTRALADVVLVGAATARTEFYDRVRVRPALRELRTASGAVGDHPALAVVTRSLDLDPTSPLLAGGRRLVVTTGAALGALPADRRRALGAAAELLSCGGDTLDPAAVVTALADRGLRRTSCEGGPTLLGALAAADVVDELDLATSPLLVGGDAPRVLTAAALRHPLRLASLLEQDGFVFARYLRT